MNIKQKASMIIISVLIIGMVLTSCGPGQVFGPALTPTPTLTPTPSVPTFTKETGLEISNSEITGEGEVAYEPGADANTLKVSLNGKVPVVDQKAYCWFCLNTIRIAPGLKVPVEYMGVFELDKSVKTLTNDGTISKHFKIVVDAATGLNTMDPNQIESITFEKLVLGVPILANSQNAIVAGPQGATLKKVGKLFFLLEGDAHLLK